MSLNSRTIAHAVRLDQTATVDEFGEQTLTPGVIQKPQTQTGRGVTHHRTARRDSVPQGWCVGVPNETV